MRFISAVFLLIFASPLFSLAQNQDSTSTPLAQSGRTLRIYFAGGSAITSPSGEYRSAIDYYKTQGGHDNATGVIELPGVYQKKDAHLWLGFLPSLIAEDDSSNYTQDTSIALSHYNFDASAIWFLDSMHAIGPLVRLDVGYSYLHRYERVNSVTRDRYYNGANIKGTVGYAWPAFSDLSFWSLNIGFFAVTAGAINETGADITVGVML